MLDVLKFLNNSLVCRKQGHEYEMVLVYMTLIVNGIHVTCHVLEGAVYTSI